MITKILKENFIAGFYRQLARNTYVNQ